MRRRESSRCRERDSWPRSLRSRSALGVTGTSRNDALPGEGEGVGKKRPSGQVA
jgi:hypothetical protein